MKILYVNAMTQESAGEAYKTGLIKGIEASSTFKNNGGIDVIHQNIFYAEKRSARLMAAIARFHSVDAVILSGSGKNTSDVDDPWLKEYYLGLSDLLNFQTFQSEDENYLENWTGPELPIFGICFGHQALAVLLGGETTRFKFRSGMAPIRPLGTALQHPLFRGLFPEQLGILDLSNAPQWPLPVIHGDHVIRAPRNFYPLCTSEYCDLQAMAHDLWPIASVQFHPEVCAVVKSDPEDAQWWENTTEDNLNSHFGTQIIANFVDWAGNKSH